MSVIECPKIAPKSLFLAGGITGCPDWQSVMIDLLKDANLILFNPRRKEFDINNKNLTEEQINWEYYHLNQADAVLFWFCKETLCPITLFELGKCLVLKKELFVGCDTEYVRVNDVLIQSRLMDYKHGLHYDLQKLAGSVLAWIQDETYWKG